MKAIKLDKMSPIRDFNNTVYRFTGTIHREIPYVMEKEGTKDRLPFYDKFAETLCYEAKKHMDFLVGCSPDSARFFKDKCKCFCSAIGTGTSCITCVEATAKRILEDVLRRSVSFSMTKKAVKNKFSDRQYDFIHNQMAFKFSDRQYDFLHNQMALVVKGLISCHARDVFVANELMAMDYYAEGN